MPAQKWTYLLSDVYPNVDRHGPLRKYEEPGEQIARIQGLQNESAMYAMALMQNGSTMVDLARNGALEEFHELLLELRQDELILYFVDKAFVAALGAGQLHVVEYMLRRGFVPADFSIGKQALFSVLSAALSDPNHSSDSGAPTSWRDARAGSNAKAKELIAGKESLSTVAAGGASVSEADGKQVAQAVFDSAKSRLASFTSSCTDCEGTDGAFAHGEHVQSTGVHGAAVPLDTACALLWCATHPLMACNVNDMRPADGYSPLHISALSGHLAATALLLAIGADVNAVGMDGITPLGAAMQAQADYGTEDAEAAARFGAICACLRAHGGCVDWEGALASCRSAGSLTGIGSGALDGASGVTNHGGSGSISTGRRVEGLVVSGMGLYTVEEESDSTGGNSTVSGVSGVMESIDNALSGGVSAPRRGQRDMSQFAELSGVAAPSIDNALSGGVSAPRRGQRDMSQFAELSGVAAPSTGCTKSIS